MDRTFGNIFKGKKILVTGHTGFKGAWLVYWLKKLGADVVGYSLEPHTNPSFFKLLELENRIEHIVGDIRNVGKLCEVFQTYRPEIVFHLAAQAIVRTSYTEPRLTYETNIMGTVNLFEAVRNADSVRVLVNVTSDKCYENVEILTGYKEGDPLGGYDPYSSSKGSAEIVTSAYRNSYFNPGQYGETHNVAVASARAGNVIGGGDWAADRLLPDCISFLLSGEEIVVRNPGAIRPWQYVLEPLGGYLLLAGKLYEDGSQYSEAWNFGPEDDDSKPVEWVVKRICEKWGNGANYKIDKGVHPHEARLLRLDCTKAKERLGWYPEFKLERALDMTIEWTMAYKNNEDLEKVCDAQIEEYSKYDK